MRARWMTRAVVAVAAVSGVLAGCGSDETEDDAADAAVVESGDGSEQDSGGESDELALGDPCELVPDTTVAEIVGDDVTGELGNVDDGLPGATCTYTIAAGGTISLSITPDGAAFFSANRSQADAATLTDIADLGDEAYVFQDTEVNAIAGDAMIQLQVFTLATTAESGGVEIVQAAIDAIG